MNNAKNATLAVDNERLVNADATPEDWLSYGRNNYADRYSKLNQITKGGAWGLGNKSTKKINPGTIYTFALGKKEPMPVYPTKPERKIISLPVSGTAVDIKKGNSLFDQFCSNCHRMNGGGSIPDLTFSTSETLNAINDIVRGGAYLPKGMPKFEDRLSERDVANIKQYILSVAKKKREETGTK